MAANRRKGLLLNLALVLFSLVFCVAALEVVLRVLHIEGSVRFTQPDNVFGHRFRAGMKHRFSSTEFDSMVSINSHGFRDAEFVTPKPEGTFRIAVLCDSFCAALQVELEDTFHSILEQRLSTPGRKVDIVNLGVLAYGNVREWMLYRLMAKELEIDAVLWFIFPYNDPSDNEDFVNKGMPRPDMPGFEARVKEAQAKPVRDRRKRINRWLDDHSYFYRWQKQLTLRAGFKVGEIMGNADPRIKEPLMLFADPDSPGSKRKWEITHNVLAEFAGELLSDGMPAIPILFMPEIAFDSGYFNEFAVKAGIEDAGLDISVFGPKLEELKDILKESGLEPVDLIPAFRGSMESSPDRLFFPIDGHWTNSGHKVVADQLAPIIRERFLGSQ